MEKLNLHLHKLDDGDASKLSPKPKALKAWLGSLPLGDMEASALHLLKALREYNRCKLAPALRLETLNIYGRLVQELSAGLAAKYRDSSFPFSERDRERCMVVNKLYEEMAHGFKWLVNDYFECWNKKSAPKKEYFDVIRISIVYLSKRLVSAYSTYSLEPDGVWHDLHQLYKLADQFQPKGHAHHNAKTDESVDNIIQA